MRRSSRLPYMIGLAAAVALVATAWFSRTRFEPVVAGVPAPSFQVSTLDGKPTDLSAYRGNVVLLNVWATWCEPCRTEMPSMQRLYTELRGRSFEILAVSVDDLVSDSIPVQSLNAFAQEFGLSFPILYSAPDSPGSIQRIFQTAGVPESFIIGKDGVIYRRIAGPTAWDSPQIRDQILRLMAE